MKYLMVGFSTWCVVFLSLLMISAVILTGCASVGSVENDVRLGRVVTAQLTETAGIVRHQPTAEYVSAVGKRLAEHIPDRTFTYEFLILDRPEPNLIAVPGGHVFITRGLLILTNSEDELANLLAHGIVHVERRHTAKQLAARTEPGYPYFPGRVVETVRTGEGEDMAGAPMDLLGGASLATYTAGQEQDADLRGMKLAAAAGYDPAALGIILSRIEQVRALGSEETGRTSFLDVHPMTPSRMTDAEEEADALTPAAAPPIAAGRAACLGKLEGLIVGWNPAQGFIAERHYLNPDRDIALSFPEDWETFHTPMQAGGVASDGGANLILTVIGREDDPREAAREYCRRLGEQLGAASVETPELTEINGLTACWANIVDPSGGEPVDIHFVWIVHRGVLFRITAFALEGRREEVRRTILGFRPLSDLERSLIREIRLEIVEARHGETLAELSRWAVNAWSVEETAVINGIMANRPLAAGVPVKVAVARPYEVKFPSRVSAPSHLAGVRRGE